ncbi:MAG: hypothetical protein KAT06_06965 [Gammaproteobacteria bacterium]|nr:hypothetical protein [Gammaproteobacteria bacterium]
MSSIITSLIFILFFALILVSNYVRVWTIGAGILGAILGSSTGVASGGTAQSGTIIFSFLFATIGFLIGLHILKEKKRNMTKDDK